MRRVRAALTGAVLLAAGVASADTTFQAVVDRHEISMNETLTLQIVISGGNLNVARPSLPPIPGFRIYSSGQSQNFSFINGQVTSQVVYSYALAPQAPGQYNIPPFSIDVGGEKYSSAPISVKVTSGSGASAPGPAAAPEEAASPEKEKDLFVTTSIDKKTAYVGEAMTLTFRFYSRARLTAQPGYSPPATTGFLAEDLPPQRQFNETLRGRPYSIVELKTALFPTAPGKLTVGPASLECRVQDFSPDPFGGDPFATFEEFFSGGRTVTLRSDPIPVQVLPLPEAGRPADFRGDVGRFTIAAAFDKASTALHEPVTLTVTVSGEGNIKAVSEPALPALDGFRAYETLSSLNVSKDGYRVRGSKVFKTILKPEVTGTLRVPPLSFSFFDPAEKTYKTARSAPLSLSVEGTGAAEPAAAAVSVPEGVRVVGEDIRYIKTRGALAPRRRPLHRGVLFLVLNLLPPLGFGGLWLLQVLRSRSAADPTGAAFRRAYRRAEKDLRAADKLARADLPAYYARLQRALRQYLADKLGVSSHGLAWDRVALGLPAGAQAEEVRTLWETFDAVRFSPSLLNPEEAAKQRAALERTLRDLENKWTR